MCLLPPRCPTCILATTYAAATRTHVPLIWPPLWWCLWPALAMLWQCLWPVPIMCPGPQCVVHCGSVTPVLLMSSMLTVPLAWIGAVSVVGRALVYVHWFLHARLALYWHPQPYRQAQEGHCPWVAQVCSLVLIII